jgi:hypothetical protein
VKYAVDVILRKADELSADWLSQLETGLVDDDFIEYAVEATLSALSLSPLSAKAVYNSLIHLRGRRVEQPFLFREAWRLAGNRHRLRSTAAVPPWRGAKYAEWCPLQIKSAEPARVNERPGWAFVGTFLAGSPAGERIKFQWSRRYCHYIALELGFSRRRQEGRTVFEAGEQLVLFRFEVRVDPAFSYDDRPGFRLIRVPSSALKYNRELLKLRRRDSVETLCPYGFRASLPCHRCRIGYDRCDSGTRPVTPTDVLETIEPLRR